MSIRVGGLLIATVLAGSTAALAGTVTVVSPGYVTNSGPGESNDPISANTWIRNNFRAGTSAGISSANPRSGTGSVQFTGTGGASKADMEYYFSSPFRLADLTEYSYDWYRASSSANPGAQAPSFRLVVSVPHQPNPVNGYLIYEPYYQTNTNPATDQWETSTINGVSFLWFKPFGAPADETYNRSLNQWLSGEHSTGFPALGPDTMVLGFSLGVGSGWNGPYSMFLDNVSYTLGDAGTKTTYNFEAATPEPASVALIASGAALLALVRRRYAR